MRAAAKESAQNKSRYDANAAAGNRGHGSGEPGVIEAEPGLMESTKMEPLIPEGGAPSASAYLIAHSHAPADSSTVGDATQQTSSIGQSAYDSVVGAAKQAYGSATGDSALQSEGQSQYENA